jgi:type I restriction enzyme S subunit
MSFPQYSAYQPSDADFIERAPSHWRIKPLWACCSCNDEVLSEATADDVSIRYVEISDVTLLEGLGVGEEMLFALAPSRARRKVRQGDVIVSTVRTYLRAIAQVEEDDPQLIVSTGFAVLRPKGVDSRYLRYVMTSEEMIAAIISRSKGVSYPAINAGDLVRLKAAFPPEPEQQVIAAFLDRETAKLDDLVAEQETLLTLLEEKRAATIAHAVTKGLDPNAPMKDSGVEWLGPVPASWSVFPLKRVVHGMCDGPFGSGLKSEHYVAEGARVVRLQNIRAGWFDASDTACVDEAYFRAELSGHEVLADDVLVAGLGDERNLVGRACVAPDDLGSALVKADCFRLRLNREIALPAFIAAQLTVGAPFAAGTLSNGSTRARIPLSVNATRRIALPATVEEQKTIIERMGQMTAAFAALGAEARTNIALLRERRAALISAAVTGRIDVRGTVAAPDKVELAA